MIQCHTFTPTAGDPDWDRVCTTTGDRDYRVTIVFPKPFGTTPEVSVSICALDVQSGTNTRLRVKAKNILTDQFDLVIETWSDTKIFSVDVAWIAFD